MGLMSPVNFGREPARAAPWIGQMPINVHNTGLMKTTNVGRFLLLPLALAGTLIVGALDDAEGQSRMLMLRLEGASRLDCTFSTLAMGDWDDPATTVEVTPSEFELSFFDIDVEEGTAEAEGQFGSSYIVLRYQSGYLHLMQMLGAGPLRLTTVLAQELEDGRFMAIHTRHEYSPTILPGFTSRPEMYVGGCIVGR